MNNDELYNDCYREIIEEKITSDWQNRLSDHIKKYKDIEQAKLEEYDSINDIFNSEAVSATGAAATTQIRDAIENGAFRKYFAQKVFEVKEKKDATVDDYDKLYEELINKLKPLCNNREPKLKLSRALCALFPKYFSVICSQTVLRDLHRSIVGTRANLSKPASAWHNISQNLAENGIQEVDFQTDNTQFTARMVLPWMIYQKLKETKDSSSVKGDDKRDNSVKHHLNQILYGPPGTGKTYETINLAVQIASPDKFQKPVQNNSARNSNKDEFDGLREDDRIEFITFHQNYSYEEFMVGIRPNIGQKTDENPANLTFVPHEGIFYKISKRAEANYLEHKEDSTVPLQNYVLIIDEINRASISRVFGELITLLEDDKRMGEKNELTVTLPNDEPFCIPPNLYLIGTMNTADKSIALIDIALRRRFSFIGMYPQYNLIPAAKNFLTAVNNKIYARKGSADFLIGHAYFMKDEPLKTIIEEKVIPLLMEYFNNNVEVVLEILTMNGCTPKFSTETYSWSVDVTF